jgi:hypothetical protein
MAGVPFMKVVGEGGLRESGRLRPVSPTIIRRAPVPVNTGIPFLDSVRTHPQQWLIDLASTTPSAINLWNHLITGGQPIAGG